jgi:NADH:ubiquinone oxidoreductase subunit 6 (subunit J)
MEGVVMSAGAWMMLLVIAVAVATLSFLVFSMARSIRDERKGHRSVWREFGLSLILLILFLATWASQLIAQWQVFTDEQLEHGQDPAVGDFVSEFAASTFENWQSEFLQLFSFVVLAALYIHKGSSESKDGEENIAASLRRIEEHLGTLPESAPTAEGEQWKLPETPLEVADAG